MFLTFQRRDLLAGPVLAPWRSTSLLQVTVACHLLPLTCFLEEAGLLMLNALIGQSFVYPMGETE